MNKLLRMLASSGLLAFTLAFGVSLAYGQITPSADAYTNSASPTTNYGANVLLDVDGATQAAYIQFNLASIPSTYTSADITKATLKLYVNTVPTAGSFNVDYVNGTWVENTITHNLAPALGTTIVASVPITTADKNQFILIDVTAALQAWLSGTANDGIALVANGTFNATFDSKENGATSHAPELDIVFGGTLSGVTTASGSGLTGGGTSGTLNLGLLTTCASGQVLEWNGTAWACTTPKGTGTITGVTTASSSGLTGGGTSGTLNLKVNTAEIPLLGGTNTFTGNQTVNGIFAASSSAFGVSGSATAASGFSAGVGGTAASPNGYGVEGVNTGSGGIGVYGYDSAGTGVSAFGVTGVSAGGTSYGVNANATGAGSTGVYGTAPQFGIYGVATGSGNTVGVYGSGVDGLQGSGTLHGVYAAAPTYGLYGVATSTTGTNFGVYGSGLSNGVYGIASNFGIYGVATATSGNSVGVYGAGVDGLQGSGSAYGVYAAASASGSTGVYGTAPQFGVYGVATAGSGNTVGVYGNGVDGLQGAGSSQGVYANGGTYGVHSFTSAGTAGTYSVYQGASATGATFLSESGQGSGVWADTNWNGESAKTLPALLATADDDYGAVLANNSSEIATAWILNLANGPTTSVVRAAGSTGSCTLTGGGDTACTGVLKSVVATSQGARRVETYSMQSPENWFEDFGSGVLSSGAVTITLDPTFTQTVNTGTAYHVFLTPNGDSKGLYVSQKTATSFEVREQGGGASSVAFDYRIVAKRVGYENVRLADVTERFNQEEARSKNMRRPGRSSAEARSGSQMTTPPPAHPVVEQQLAPKMLVLPVLPKAVPLPHRAARASKPEVNQK
jgi:hypothetical protein